ncbi:isopentenyl-diphosphate Delta-isomerase [Salipiger sp. PrR002]|uniref:isopentenyl-diphosphate Delta-isomerase n=1 Tax=Salipiger sp. PrR002 TaxID=2706489 RepID=UPI0013B6FA9C|nr:isopentenyl-diphosphate Delta-isomerase [Salipiger sp. PrR002]NDV98180.1 isopentenyl-diphosphate Delta-isomerase [Salipiger sp. PrR002]NDW54892.1 isopentenyl-diphosphate Delta-isomerase [Salipiger sp. PrR004]
MAQDIPAWIDGQLAPADKLDVHLKGLRHKAVSVFVMRGGQTLLQRRALGKYHTPGLWANTCCTHPHWGEEPRDCAIRRLDEELGLKALEPQHRGQVEYRAEVGGGMTEHEVVEIYVAEVGVGVEPAPNPEEVMQTEWLSLDALRARIAAEPEAFTPWLRIYLADHAEMILG